MKKSNFTQLGLNLLKFFSNSSLLFQWSFPLFSCAVLVFLFFLFCSSRNLVSYFLFSSFSLSLSILSPSFLDLFPSCSRLLLGFLSPPLIFSSLLSYFLSFSCLLFSPFPLFLSFSFLLDCLFSSSRLLLFCLLSYFNVLLFPFFPYSHRLTFLFLFFFYIFVVFSSYFLYSRNAAIFPYLFFFLSFFF